jgi:predicted acetyltransferase
VYERFRLQQPGALTRPPEYWEVYFTDPERWREGASARFYVTYTSASGEIEGYVAYRIKDEWKHGFPDNGLLIMQMIAPDPEARFALWQYCLEVDLVSRVESYNAPNEEPIRWMLSDFRRLRVTNVHDSLWLRFVDIPAALSSRRYAIDGRLVFGVTDRFCPENDGCYELEGSPEGATCTRTRGKPDIELSIADLSAVYLGGVSFTPLARAFRVVENTQGALHRADLMFSSDMVPWCTTGF